MYISVRLCACVWCVVLFVWCTCVVFVCGVCAHWELYFAQRTRVYVCDVYAHVMCNAEVFCGVPVCILGVGAHVCEFVCVRRCGLD